MGIQERYRAEGSSEVFNNPMDALKECQYQSQIDGGSPKKLTREVMYTHDTEWRSYTLNLVQVPEQAMRDVGIAIV